MVWVERNKLQEIDSRNFGGSGGY